MRLECKNAVADMVESSRDGRRLTGESRAHLMICAICEERWDAELALAASLNELRNLGGTQHTFGQRSRQRAELLKQFDQQAPKRVYRSWWGLAAAAALLCMVGGGLLMRQSLRMQSLGHEQGSVREGVIAEELTDVQSEAQDAGFIAVPYVPPLAPGELVHVVHTQLQPAQLASLGVNVDPTLTTDMPADILVGADGFPRAVRISEEVSGEGGF